MRSDYYVPPPEPRRRLRDTTRFFVRLVQQQVNRGEPIGSAASSQPGAQGPTGRLGRLARKVWPFGRR